MNIIHCKGNHPPASKESGEFRIFIRLAVFSRCPSVCEGVRGVNFEILLLPEFFVLDGIFLGFWNFFSTTSHIFF